MGEWKVTEFNVALFKSPEDRDGSIAAWVTAGIIVFILLKFSHEVVDEIDLVLGTVIGYWGSVVKHYHDEMKEKRRNGGSNGNQTDNAAMGSSVDDSNGGGSPAKPGDNG